LTAVVAAVVAVCVAGFAADGVAGLVAVWAPAAAEATRRIRAACFMALIISLIG
jgi:hypothetical protein